MKNDTQAQADALDALWFRLTNDGSWAHEENEKIYNDVAALQSKPVDVEGLKKTFCKDNFYNDSGGIVSHDEIKAYNQAIDDMNEQGYLNNPPQSPVTKEDVKMLSSIARIEGLASGMAGIENMEEFDKDGIVRGLKEIEGLAKAIVDK